MQAYAQGIPQAFEELYSRHAGRVYSFVLSKVANRSKADEIFQEIFLKLHRFRARFRSDLPFLPWLFTLARNVLIDVGRREASERQKQLSAAQLEQPGIKSIFGLAENPGAQELEQAMSVLGAKEQSALNYRFQSDLSYAQIAKKLGTSSANSRQLVSRALKRMRAYLKGREGK